MSEIIDVLKEVTDLTEAFNRQRQEIIEKMKPNFHSLFKPFLTANPDVKELVFEAYTPYFNDGDTCEYSFNELRIVLNSDEEDSWDWDYGWSEDELRYSRTLDATTKSKLENLFAQLKPIDTAFHQIPEEVMEGIVGDHVRVKITTSGIETEDYDHD